MGSTSYRGPNGSRFIRQLGLKGFKSLRDWTRIEVGRLTLLAGANSSGKSAIMQPVLLLKQTIESSFDTGPLSLAGPNVNFTATDQLLWKGVPRNEYGFVVEIEGDSETVAWTFRPLVHGFGLVQLDATYGTRSATVSEESSSEELTKLFDVEGDKSSSLPLKAKRVRCDFRVYINSADWPPGLEPPTMISVGERLLNLVSSLIHIPGIRGNIQRSYPASQVGIKFPGQFQNYVASLIELWKEESRPQLDKVVAALQHLGLSSAIAVRRLNATEVDILVSRTLSSNGVAEMVSIADVGLGVGHVLPVLVGLAVAEFGQTVYIEQPEIHLHPRAQALLADVLISAAQRGVTVIAETHSSILLKAIQTRVARGELPPELTRLHWFNRNPETGETKVESTQLDAHGRYGEWPEDFSEVELEVEDQFLSASDEAEA